MAGALAALGALAACDTFFIVDGHVVTCGTSDPLPDVSVTLRIDRGVGGRREAPWTFAPTDAMGNFQVGTYDPDDSWGTIILAKPGYQTLEVQYRGIPEKTVELCLTPLPAP